MSRNRNHKPTAGQQERLRARTDAASRALRALVRDLYIEHFGPLPKGGTWTLDLKVEVKPEDNWSLRFLPDLPAQLLPHMEALEAAVAVYQEGHVYCFRCEAPTCPHSRPENPRDVFVGYDPLGCPRWREFTQYLLERGDERIQELYGDRPALIAHLVRGRDLKEKQLASFGRSSKTYALLGQLLAGYFPLPDGDFFALGFQIVEVRDQRGQPRLELNTLYTLPKSCNLSDLLVTRFDWVMRARRAAREGLETLNRKLVKQNNGERGETLKKIPEVLRKLKTDVERGKRQSGRRTQHARDRKLLARPVDKAMADLAEARPERMYLDARTKAIVLCAAKGRCHIFSEAGRHITSFVIPTESVRLRVRKQRWTQLEAGHLTRFMENVGGQSG